jgi:hypothetical protein
MPWRGITAIGCGEKATIMYPKLHDPKVPTLTKTTIFDKEEGKKSKRWERLESGQATIKEIIKEYGDRVTMKKIATIKVNGNIVKVTDLYSFEGSVYCVLGVEKNRNSDERNIRSLFIVGAKSAKEMAAAGYTKNKESYLPLFVCVNGSSVTMLNSL